MNKTDVPGKDCERFIAMPGINRFAERLKIAMGDLTNVALAGKCEMSESAVRSYLKGRSYPGIDKIQAIAEACNAPLVWLITGEGIGNNSESIAQLSEDQLASVLSVMTKDQRHQLALAIVQHGITGIINALRGIESISAFAMLPESERVQILRLHGDVKKGASVTGEEHDLTDPTRQRAGGA